MSALCTLSSSIFISGLASDIVWFLCSSYSASESLDRAACSPWAAWSARKSRKSTTSRCSVFMLSLSRNTTPVNFLGLGSTFSCVSTSQQVSLYWKEDVINLTQKLLSEWSILDGGPALASLSSAWKAVKANIPIFLFFVHFRWYRGGRDVLTGIMSRPNTRSSWW